MYITWDKTFKKGISYDKVNEDDQSSLECDFIEIDNK